MDETILTLDTTLRDGEQSPGVSMCFTNKLVILKHLESANVDTVEVGFAASSPTDKAVVGRVAFVSQECTGCSLARAGNQDVRAAAEALRFSRRPRIHTFIASSDLHVKTKLRMHRRLVLEKAKCAVRLSRRSCDDVEFSPEDCSRSAPDFLVRLFGSVTEESVTAFNITDTVGFSLPTSFGDLVRRTRATNQHSDRAIFSLHCHNDLGLATANTAMGLKFGGARQTECTVIGLGERAGNTPLEELMMVVKLNPAYFRLAVSFNTRLTLSLAVATAQTTKCPIAPTKPIAGRNVFSHASGIHQDGVIKNRLTYEIMAAEEVGQQPHVIVLSRLSGFSGFHNKLQELGVRFAPDVAKRLYHEFKQTIGSKTIRTANGLLQHLWSLPALASSVSSSAQSIGGCTTLTTHQTNRTSDAEG